MTKPQVGAVTLTCGLSCGAGDRDRTGMASLEGWGSTIELHPHERPPSERVLRGVSLMPAVARSEIRRLPGAGRGPDDGDGVWRSLVARPLWERKAAGSNPATPTDCPRH